MSSCPAWMPRPRKSWRRCWRCARKGEVCGGTDLAWGCLSLFFFVVFWHSFWATSFYGFEVHQELQTACLMVRTCRSDKLKSALLRRCALAGAPGGGGLAPPPFSRGSLVGRKPYLE